MEVPFSSWQIVYASTPPLSLIIKLHSWSTLFQSKPRFLKLLFSSPNLFPPLLSPPLQLSLARFLSSASLLLSASSSIASHIGLLTPFGHLSALSHNCLQLLQCPNKNNVIVFLSTGYNYDQVGFLVILFKESGFDVLADENNDVFRVKNRFNYQICKILVNPVVDISDFKGHSLVTVGYLSAGTMYSVHWFSVKAAEVSEKPVLSCLGFKVFKSCSVVSACWSPHLLEDNVVLLESGALFPFDLDSCINTPKTNMYFKRKGLRVPWNENSGSSKSYKWLGCEFSWHPRILIVA